MQDRIRWEDSEVAVIVEGAAQYLYRVGEEAKGRPLCQAVRHAQATLEKSRRREITGVHTLGRIGEPVEKRLAELKLEGSEPTKSVEDETPQPHSDAASDVADLMSVFAEKFFDSLGDTAERMIRMMPTFVDMVADRVVEKLEAKGLTAPANMLSQYIPGRNHAPHVPHAPSAKKVEPARPTMLVVGLKNDQRHILERKFAREVTFKFYGKSLPKNIGSATCDYAIGMVGFLSHPVDGQLVENFQGRYFRLSNGMTQLEAKIHELCKRYENTH